MEQYKKDFIKNIYTSSQRITDVSPIFITAQACLESGYGKSKVGRNNIFGITKGSGWVGEVVLITTTEVFKSANVVFKYPEEIISVTPRADGRFTYKVKRLFRDYPSIDKCLEDHFNILKKPHFAHAWAYRNNPEEFVAKLQSGVKKYATDPNYVASMCAMFNTVRRVLKT